MKHRLFIASLLVILSSGMHAFAQAPDGPQTDPPAAAARPVATPASRAVGRDQTITVPAGTRIGVTLENGISTYSAKPGDSVYFRTSFPITINNKVVVPVGSYLRGEVTDAKRPGRMKGKGELRIRLNTLILPNGYTVDLNAEPRSTDAGKTRTDSEGKITGPDGNGKDPETVAATTVTGAGIGAIAGGDKGAGIGAGIGGVAGLAAGLSSPRPEAQFPPGALMDSVLERDLQLGAEQGHYTNRRQPNTLIVQPVQQ